LTRRRLRTDFGAWCEHALAPQGFAPAGHHRLIIRELEAVARGQVRRLMLFLPPGSAKSTYASDLFPAWYLAQQGGRAIIAASNTADLAQAFSRRVRGRVREHGSMLGYALAREAEELWTTTHDGQYRAAGVGGAITGFRADLALIDDPVKSREEADSETRRNRVWEWFNDDLTTRLKPNSAVVLIMTRWHEDDLAGRLLDRQPGQWRVLSLPALAEGPDDPLGRAPGEWLWGDDGYGYAGEIAARQSLTDGRTWSALYQQRPAPDSGDYFRREWLQPVAEMPERDELRIYGASDYAVTSAGGDYTVHVVAGVDREGKIYLLDLWRGQADSAVWIDEFCRMVREWRPHEWAEEGGQIRSAVGPFLERRMRETGARVARRQVPSRADKATRAQAIRGRMALDGLRIPVAAPWRGAFEAELLSFPAGRHDDMVDALSLLGQMLDTMTGPRPALQPVQPRWQHEGAWMA
jgi:predicted phage terminase large subunit-like protein